MNRETEVQTGRVLRLPHDEKGRRQISAVESVDCDLIGQTLSRGSGIVASQRAGCGSGQSLSYVDPDSKCDQV